MNSENKNLKKLKTEVELGGEKMVFVVSFQCFVDFACNFHFNKNKNFFDTKIKIKKKNNSNFMAEINEHSGFPFGSRLVNTFEQNTHHVKQIAYMYSTHEIICNPNCMPIHITLNKFN